MNNEQKDHSLPSASLVQNGLLGAVELRREETEIRDHSHLMDAEGTSDIQPSELDVQHHLSEYGWIADEIDIFYDSMQKIWRWNCSISKPVDKLLNEAEILSIKRLRQKGLQYYEIAERIGISKDRVKSICNGGR